MKMKQNSQILPDNYTIKYLTKFC